MRREIAKGATWMVLFRLFDRLVGLASTVILARLLLPSDFGVVAMAMSVIGLIELATAFSFEIALIQKPDPKRVHFDTAWTLNVLLAAGGALVTVALAHPTAAFYGEPRLAPMLWAIAAAWLVSGFENIGIVEFRRQMDFAREFRFLATKRCATFLVTLAAAFALRSYWALVIGMAAGRVFGVLLSYAMHPFRPRPSLAASRELFGFSGWMLANNIANAAIGRVPQFFVGRLLGAPALGAYTMGAEIAQLAYTELVAPISRALIPGYSRLAGDADALRRICIDSAAAVMLIVLPASIGLALVADPLVRVVLGEKWGEAVPVIQILAFTGITNGFLSNNAAAYIALGRPYLTTAVLVTRLTVLALVLMALSFAGRVSLPALAAAEVVATLAALCVGYPLLFSALRIRIGQYLAALWRPLFASGAMALAVTAASAVVERDPGFATALAQLAVGVGLGVVTYALALRLLWQLSGRPPGVEVELARFAVSIYRSVVRRLFVK